MENTSTNSFDEVLAEKQQIDTLLERGMDFTVDKKSLLRFFGKKQRVFKVYQPYLGTLDYLSQEYINMAFSEERLKADPVGESKRLIEHNAKRCGRVIAIAVLNSQWKIKLFAGLLANYFSWHLTPGKLFDLVMLINTLTNMGAFTNSIRFLSVDKRTTNPILIEEPKNQEAEAFLKEWQQG
ncbi:hypothetical protein GCM10028806_28560 [Spirosoma terrae]|uniref:Uncharacterized protein n=1 Tax=Spirosoma terrae TaxID=1968276 RepID=A0A6L9L9E7_9BACT|nr:hypothetical protein [Spirosoma terrae]NDU97184.1 hypothetical protein [Spirosoma terrae]